MCIPTKRNATKCICTVVGWLRCTHASCHVYTMRFYNYKVLYIFVYIITTIYTIAYRTITTIVLVKHTVAVYVIL